MTHHLSEGAAQKLASFLETVEELHEERDEINKQVREVFAAAKAHGFDEKAMRKMLAERKADANELEQQRSIEEVYRQALQAVGHAGATFGTATHAPVPAAMSPIRGLRNGGWTN